MLSTLLPQITLPRLQTFEVIGKINQPTSLSTIRPNAFLARHATSARILEIHGVLLINWDNPWDIAAVMANALRNIGENLDLRAAEVLLNRRNEHANKVCRGESRDGVLCDGTCTKYMSVGDSWIEVKGFEDLQNLDVKLEDGSWGFGEFIMRH